MDYDQIIALTMIFNICRLYKASDAVASPILSLLVVWNGSIKSLFRLRCDLAFHLFSASASVAGRRSGRWTVMEDRDNVRYAAAADRCAHPLDRTHLNDPIHPSLSSTRSSICCRCRCCPTLQTTVHLASVASHTHAHTHSIPFFSTPALPLVWHECRSSGPGVVVVVVVVERRRPGVVLPLAAGRQAHRDPRPHAGRSTTAGAEK